MYRTTFTVQGRMAFPLDMLRYDACFPDSQEDVHAMDDTPQYDRDGDPVQVTLTKYHRYKEHHIEERRWASFSWGVVHASIRTEKVQ